MNTMADGAAQRLVAQIGEMDLPELPQKDVVDTHLPTGVRIYGYTAEQMREYARASIAARQPVGASVEEDVYCAIADMIEPYVQREGSNPNGELPASVHDSVAILLDHWAKTRQPAGQEPVKHACSNCDRKHADVICPTCAGIAWHNGRLHEFDAVRELSTSLGEGVLDHLLPEEWHEKPLLRFQGAYDEGDPSVGMPGSCGNVLAADQEGTVLGDYLAARAAKEGGQ